VCAFLIILNTEIVKGWSAMARTTTMTVRLSGALSDHVSANVGESGAYENVSEYIRDLIRRDKERGEQELFERLRAELQHAFAAPESSYQPLTAADVIARNRN
jgi:antitoxin ParD1/3/4